MGEGALAEGRPRALDLFCGAGGVSVGLQRAGFEVTGVDIRPQPHYRGGTFARADAMTYPLEGFDLIWASPPCQKYSVANNIHGRLDHPDLVAAVRERLLASGIPWMMENVPGSPLRNPIQLCGLALGCGVRRHRLVESSLLLMGSGCGDHSIDYLIVFGNGVRRRGRQIRRTAKDGPVLHRATAPLEEGRLAMGISWMNRNELSQAIPPAYAEFLGRQAIDELRRLHS